MIIFIPFLLATCDKSENSDNFISWLFNSEKSSSVKIWSNGLNIDEYYDKDLITHK